MTLWENVWAQVAKEMPRHELRPKSWGAFIGATVAFLGEIAGIPFPDENLPQLRAARLDARLMADQTQAAWVDWLEAETAHRPVLLLLEDLHWGDGPSVQYTDAALRVLTIDVDLGIFGKFISDQTLRNQVESRIKGLIA